MRVPTFLLVSLAVTSMAYADQQPASPAASPSIAKESRLYELRTYHANPGKLEALHARFRNHTNRLFQKHGMTIVGFWAPVHPPEAAADTLVYVLAYASQEARDAAWKAFSSDPEWIAARDASETDGKLVAKIESVLMRSTDYAPVK